MFLPHMLLHLYKENISLLYMYILVYVSISYTVCSTELATTLESMLRGYM